MSGKTVEIVGAGLSGLVAGTCLAREGKEVIIYERHKNFGGRPDFRPDPAGTPINLDILKNFIGIDISSACRRMEKYNFYVWGKHTVKTLKDDFNSYMIERGSRKTSLDYLLAEEAVKAGVKIKYNHNLDRDDLRKLPANSIISAGLEEDTYKSLGIDYLSLYGCYARGKADKDEPEVGLYFDDYTTDYGFTCSINKVSFAFLIGRTEEMTEAGIKKFKDQIAATAPYKFGPWKEFKNGVLPHVSAKGSKLFWEDKILAGTVTCAMDPILYFGMLPAMISGRIAATAVTDRDKAIAQHKAANASYARYWRIKEFMRKSPDFMRRPMMNMAASLMGKVPTSMMKRYWKVMPGYNMFG